MHIRSVILANVQRSQNTDDQHCFSLPFLLVFKALTEIKQIKNKLRTIIKKGVYRLPCSTLFLLRTNLLSLYRFFIF